jgi:protein O-mannosyl-transferase
MPLWRRRWFPPLLLSLLILSIYHPVAHFHFIDWDDWLLLAENPDFSPVRWANFTKYWFHGQYQLYAPLSYCAWAAIAWTQQTLTHLTPLSPGAFHLSNLALHLAASWMVFLLLYRLIPRSLPAFAGALVFALHPIQIEPIAWVASFNTLLSVLLTIIALWAYIHHAQANPSENESCRGGSRSSQTVSKEHRHKIRWFIASCIFLLLALFAKPMAIPAPAIALLIDALILRRSIRQWSIPILIWIALTIPFIIIGRLVQVPYSGTQISIWLHPLIMADSFAFYLVKLFWPLHQTIDYQRTPVRILQSHQIWYTWILPVTVIFLATAASKFVRRPIFSKSVQIADCRLQNENQTSTPSLGTPGEGRGGGHSAICNHQSAFAYLLPALAIMFVATLPTSGIVGFAFQRYSTVADRYMYLGMLGVTIGIAGLAKSLPKQLLVVCIIALAVLMMFRDTIRLRDWHDTLTITSNATQVSDDCALDHRIRAFALSQLRRDDEAIAQYKLAIHYDPAEPDTYYDEANVLFRDGQTNAALALYTQAISMRPKRSDYHHNYAVALMHAGQTSQAGAEFRAATELDPSSQQARIDYAKWQALQNH